MLPYHSALVVAEQFGMLEALHPGRIDLGLGRAPGTDPLTALALRRSVEAANASDGGAVVRVSFGAPADAETLGEPGVEQVPEPR